MVLVGVCVRVSIFRSSSSNGSGVDERLKSSSSGSHGDEGSDLIGSAASIIG